ncbi:hypothetical protein U732_4079 [Clostridium argentinense CDC 2741]|uniref:DUF1259 domain-containing protein n=1 Tax=Clostridium argentinense CDC 2741 TaxID=1418104 RepID=A0A0C1RD59_9CLOT|nr:DUF1259 domain-containing protein [Clostridium argentinense]ARC84910.1 hypothetical protein RSJ17_10470 [Clostridium argentinense]KIE48326.1 hypothetical protein U732_4079 [Clostridium argentinense CDC 2741]NFF40711.1 DUF1259 domain-containing protein [Clostridium argentinense]NFP51942.1 DUF1259 domain-containing protein [Clostridium argentinense]NFP73880.1 DUF1259 domain-containing protein [Clostridium argentinense]
MSDFCQLCNEFARILGAEILSTANDVCTVTFMRDINAEILGRRTHSPLALAALFSFESPDNEGRTLNLGETVILQEEINDFISILRKNGILVTALHNHWLFDDPRLMYIHFESIDDPIDFARKVAEALCVLRRVETTDNSIDVVRRIAEALSALGR